MCRFQGTTNSTTTISLTSHRQLNEWQCALLFSFFSASPITLILYDRETHRSSLSNTHCGPYCVRWLARKRWRQPTWAVLVLRESCAHVTAFILPPPPYFVTTAQSPAPVLIKSCSSTRRPARHWECKHYIDVRMCPALFVRSYGKILVLSFSLSWYTHGHLAIIIASTNRLLKNVNDGCCLLRR